MKLQLFCLLFAMNPTVYFNGEFYQSKYLPLSYIPLWILILPSLFYFFYIRIYLSNKKNIQTYYDIKENSIFKFDFKTKRKFDFIVLLNFIL